MASQLPKVQQAAVIENPGENATVRLIEDAPVSDPGVHEILVKLAFTGLCGSEVRALQGWGPYKPIVGHEGIGTVVKTGPHVEESIMGRRVGIKWLYSACGECTPCRRGFPNNCPKQQNTGKHVPGTLQQYAVADARYVSTIADDVSSEIAAPLLCAGLTMSGALSRLSDAAQGDWVVVLGAGGGLGHLGVQIASRLCGYRVIAVDTGREKRELSLASGAQHFVDFEREDAEAVVKKLTGEGAAAALVVPGSERAFALAPGLVRNMGTIATIGLPRNDFMIPVSASLCSARALTITGVSVGTEEQMEELLQETVTGKIKPTIEVLDFEEVPSIFERLKQNTITGRVVVRIPE